MTTSSKVSISLVAGALLGLLGGCAGHANDRPVATTTTTTTTDANGAAVAGATTTATAHVDDDALENNVQATLASTPGVNAQEINVNADDGVVTLSGDVDSASAASAAVQATQGVTGVTAVHNELTVSNPPQG
ncbi:MAG TPA: BON domain-containing protein [Gammaproteobacteria bacterium]|jgi:hyperosmotically inducible protein